MEIESKADKLHPLTIKAKEFDAMASQSKRLRISAMYLDQTSIKRISDFSGIYEGDILEKIIIPEDQKKTPIEKKIQKVKQGKGVQLFLSGDLYNGDWEDNKMHGLGGFYFQQDNKFYKGEFRDDKISGRGVFFFSDSQDFYMGEVEDGKFHGKGLFYSKGSNQWELGVYEEGNSIKCIKNGTGRP